MIHRSALALALGACTPPFEVIDVDTTPMPTSDASTTTTTGDPPHDPIATSTSEEATTALDGGGSSPGPGFIQDPDGGTSLWECTPWEATCPEGERCNLYWPDTGDVAFRCVPIIADPDEFGDPCRALGEPGDGADSCVAGAVCWDIDENGDGTCIAFCQGSEANPICPDPTTHCVGRDFLLCLPNCCPLLQDCHEGELCAPANDRFECVPDASGDAGAFGDPCEYINVCDPGLFCAAPQGVPGCESPGCCSALCDLTDPRACLSLDPTLACIPWFEEGQAPPGEENVGACLLAE